MIFLDLIFVILLFKFNSDFVFISLLNESILFARDLSIFCSSLLKREEIHLNILCDIIQGLRVSVSYVEIHEKQ